MFAVTQWVARVCQRQLILVSDGIGVQCTRIVLLIKFRDILAAECKGISEAAADS